MSSAEESSIAPVYTSKWRDTVKDLVAGAAGGVAQVYLDLVKVRLQTQGGTNNNALFLNQQIWKHEGPLSFYKGSFVPLLGVGACVSIQFGAFHYFRQLIEHYNNQTNPTLLPTPTLPQYYLAGCFAGLTNSLISGPIEHIRIRLQTQPHGSLALYTGPFDCARKIVLQAGILRGLYRGQVATFIREGHGIGVWFASYEGFLGFAAHRQGKRREELPSWQIAVCGGLAGEMLWLLSYPVDVMKSKMQSDWFGKDQRYKGFREAVRMTWRGEGVGGLFFGIGPALARAMPVSAGTFAV
ncbi:hepatocellular carcinoma down-regulated mitochondrial carrier protein [Aspergillus eucalypticola CBS 122712]|uniref:Hepatocellular carcinoma down-regulated mitochondrial carrier protein n=1 Tax=Aspergillus eucalypticola (strain CBS 122712 / IBT 29274) TaxID=1448314 RepID=A0A317WCZ3_ASPEC|nr:hepatocellular carcinoma down-regulated mitochondrial carrier protein [Aspergillus eucalypticola CBS 122712]PWY84396.1 hepatocellular carcinoma down-regulated mitochondrial carrier protein [Aspergillus eucalypticola CBS 122712]